MELYQKKASEMAMHDELHEQPHMLGAVYNPMMELYKKKASEMAMHDELHEKPHMLGASAPLVYLYQKKVNELATHDETKKDLAAHMLGATYKNPFHVSTDAPVKGMTYIPQVNKRNDLTGFDVKPKIIMLI